VTTLVALASSSVAGWVLTFHLADDHHAGGSRHHEGVAGLDMLLHGHGHDEGTPAHEHPLLRSSPAPVPGKLFLELSAMVGNAPEFVVVSATPSRGAFSPTGPTHDPPRLGPPAVLRI